MIKTVIRAPLLSISGYGVHSRQIFRWLLSRKDLDIETQIVQWGITTWYVNPEFEGGLVGEAMRRSASQKIKYALSFQVQLPNEWDPELANINVGVTAGVETDVCNPEWIECVNKMDLVIVPSNHTRETFLRSGDVKTDVIVIPESYIDAISYKKLPSLNLDLETKFNFMMMGQLTGNNAFNDRKNTFLTLKWLCETFQDDPDVGILIKTNSGRNTKFDKELTTNALKAALAEVRKGPYPKVHLLHGLMKSHEIASIYRLPTVKAFLSLTRGEGYGLPILEAAASGLPVIATNWSGHLDFLKHTKFIKVDYELSQIHETRVDNGIFIKESKWAEPIETDAKKKLLKFRKMPEKPRIWAEEKSQVLLDKFSHKTISQSYDSMLSDVLGGFR